MHGIILACLLIMSAQAHSSTEEQIIDSPSPSGEISIARGALLRFNETENRLNDKADRKSLRSAFNDNCYTLRPECLDYVRENRLDVLTQESRFLTQKRCGTHRVYQGLVFRQ